MHLRIRRPWEIPSAEATPESAYLGRREFLRSLGLAGLALSIGGGLPGEAAAAERSAAPGAAKPAAPPAKSGALYPARRNPAFVLDRPLTDEVVATRYNNFYEFTEEKDRVWRLVEQYRTRPWRIEVAGLVEKPRAIDLDELIAALPAEERLYRHRCVEAWAMAVPWTGTPLREFVKWAKPLSGARYLRAVSVLRPEEMPGQKRASWYPWPYYEAWRMDEATNDLAMLVWGLYGHDLPKQNGAPIRVVTPWKYGYKSAKAMVRFEFTAKPPRTFWNDVAPNEYGFLSNVNPAVAHPRWSQASERVIGTEERRPTLPYNGYAELVAGMYDRKSETFRS